MIVDVTIKEIEFVVGMEKHIEIDVELVVME